MEEQAGDGDGSAGLFENDLTPNKMTFTGKQNSAFEEHVLEDVQLLDKAVEWIKASLTIEQLFDKQLLRDWVGDNSKPEDVFAVEDLETWAEANGYVKL